MTIHPSQSRHTDNVNPAHLRRLCAFARRLGARLEATYAERQTLQSNICNVRP
jgi:hypothetical protein